MRHNLLETIMGAIVLIVASVFFFYAYQSNSMPQGEGLILTAKFSRIDGLNVGGDVKMSGVKIGHIQSIDIDPQSYRAVVHFSIRNGISIPDDSSAEVMSESLMGGRYLAIVPGGSESPLKKGELITDTRSPLSLETLVAKYLTGGSGGPSQSQSSPETIKPPSA